MTTPIYIPINSVGGFHPSYMLSSIYCMWVFLFFFLNWRIIALQNFVIFCHTSTRVSHRYTLSPPSQTFLSSPSPFHRSGCHSTPVWIPWVTWQIPIGYLFYIWYSKFLCYSLNNLPSPSSPLPCPEVCSSVSVSPLLPWK